MDELISRPSEEETKPLGVGDKVKSRLPTDRYRRSGEILEIFNSGIVLIKWDMLQALERMRAQALVKL